MDTLRLNNIEEAIEDFREGKFVIVVEKIILKKMLGKK